MVCEGIQYGGWRWSEEGMPLIPCGIVPGIWCVDLHVLSGRGNIRTLH
jgi:hypothetical protein